MAASGAGAAGDGGAGAVDVSGVAATDSDMAMVVVVAAAASSDTAASGVSQLLPSAAARSARHRTSPSRRRCLLLLQPLRPIVAVLWTDDKLAAAAATTMVSTPAIPRCWRPCCRHLLLLRLLLLPRNDRVVDVAVVLLVPPNGPGRPGEVDRGQTRERDNAIAKIPSRVGRGKTIALREANSFAPGVVALILLIG